MYALFEMVSLCDDVRKVGEIDLETLRRGGMGEG